MTHRQFRTWKQWLTAEWNRPNRTDHYIMRAALETRIGNAGKKARDVQLEDFKVKFKVRSAKDPVVELTKEERQARATAMSKAKWLGIMTSPVKKVGTA